MRRNPITITEAAHRYSLTENEVIAVTQARKQYVDRMRYLEKHSSPGQRASVAGFKGGAKPAAIVAMVTNCLERKATLLSIAAAVEVDA